MKVDPAYLRRLADEFERDSAAALRLGRVQRTLQERRHWHRDAKKSNLIRIALLRYARDLEKGATS